MRRLLLIPVAALVALVAAASASANYYVPRPHTPCRAHYVRKTVRVRKRSHGHVVRKNGRVVWVRQVRCVYVAPKTTAPVTITAPTATLPAPTLTAPAPVSIRAGIDPSYTQDPNDNLHVTWNFSASAATATLPAGTLSLTVYEHGTVGAAGGCTINVAAAQTGGTCTTELPEYGTYDVTVTYTGNDPTVAPSTSTDTQTIEPLPATVNMTWGTDAPTAGPSVSAPVKGSTASVTVSDANFEGATSLPLSDDLGDSCTAAVSGTQATCQMAVSGTPSRFLLSYPGGTSTQSTRNIPPNGVQQVTTQWPAQTVAVNNPSVTVQQATVEECGGGETGVSPNPWPNNGGNCTYGNPLAWPNPLSIGHTTTVELYAVAFGSLPTDRDPTHGTGAVSGYLTFNVTGGAQGVDYTATDGNGSTNDNSTDCSKVLQQQGGTGPDEPVGGCYLHFTTPGTYTVTVTYTSEDPNYVSVASVDSETINVD